MLNNNIQEVWKDIEGYPNHQVSNLGRVRNATKVMSSYEINSGYLCIDLTQDKRKQKFLVHRLVLSTFEPGASAEGLEVHHKDENKHNNTLSNLRWATSKENKAFSIESGTYAKIFTMKNTLGKKHKKNTASRFHNVSYDKSKKRWTACIIHNKVILGFKRFHTEEEAAVHVNHIIETYGLTDRPKNII